MALDSTIVIEIRTGGSDDNGGGYSSDDGGTDYSQQAAAELGPLTDLACLTASTTLTSATGGFTTAMVDNLIQIKSGTNFVVGWYRITVRTDTNTVTIDRTASDGSDATAGTGSVGGALASPGAITDFLVSGNVVHIASGTYSITSATPGKGGPISIATSVSCTIKGYNAARNDLDGTVANTNNPLLQASGVGTFTAVELNNGNLSNFQFVTHVSVDGNGQASIIAFYGGTGAQVVACKADSVATGFGKNGIIGYYFHCFATGCTTGFEDGAYYFCEATGYTVGFRGDDFSRFESCLAYDGTDGFLFDDDLGLAINCVSDGNSGDGFDVSGRLNKFVNCVSTNNTGYGWKFNNTSNHTLNNCRTYNNTAGPFLSEPAINLNHSGLSAEPWENAATDDYRPNDTVGGGASLQGTGFASPEQTVNTDIGAVQHADPAGALSFIQTRRNTLIGR